MNKTKTIFIGSLFAIAFVSFAFQNFPAQKAYEPWTEQQIL